MSIKSAKVTIKKCPCCGGVARAIESRKGAYMQYGYVACMDCGLHTGMYKSKAEAAAAWNRRSGEKIREVAG